MSSVFSWSGLMARAADGPTVNYPPSRSTTSNVIGPVCPSSESLIVEVAVENTRELRQHMSVSLHPTDPGAPRRLRSESLDGARRSGLARRVLEDRTSDRHGSSMSRGGLALAVSALPVSLSLGDVDRGEVVDDDSLDRACVPARELGTGKDVPQFVQLAT